MLPEKLSKLLYKTKVVHSERLVSEEPCIYIANHTSLLDAVLLFTHLPKDVVFVVKNDASNRFRWLLKGQNIITVTPSNPYSVRSMLRVLKEGKSIVIFPEGRITVTNNLMKMYTGVSYLAMKTGYKIIPIAINGAVEAKKFTYLEDKIQTKWFPETSLYIGEPFAVPVNESLSTKENKEAGTHLIYRKLQELLFESRMPECVNLVEMFRQRVQDAPNFVIAEEVNSKRNDKEEHQDDKKHDGKKENTFNKIKMKELWRNILGLSSVIAYQCKEDTVGILLPTNIANITTLYAVLKSGKSPAMLNFSMDSTALISCLETGNVSTIITSKEFVEKGNLTKLITDCSAKAKILYLEDMALSITKKIKLSVLLNEHKPVTAYPSEVILFTSGSEGLPKGVLLSHENIYANIQQARLMVDLTSKDKVLQSLPMFHSFGLLATFLCTLSYVPAFLVPSPLLYKDIPEIAYDRKATILIGTSTFLNAYGKYAHPYDFYSVRHVISGAEKCQDHVKELWMEKFGKRILEGYGLTETTLLLSLQTPMMWKKNSVGCLVPGVKYQLEKVEGVEDGGKLKIQAPNLMRGYLIHGKGFVKTPEWFDTGDIVTIDEKGFVTIQGRQKLFVKIAGEMVSLQTVEEHAKLALKTTEVLAVGITDKEKGEKIVLATTSSGADVQSLREYWKEHNLNPLSLPTKIHTLDAIPILGSGKVNRIKVKKLIEE